MLIQLLKTLVKKYRQFITFSCVGVINTGVDFLVFSLVLFVASASISVAQVAGYISGLICSFLLNKYITFRNNAKNHWQGFLFLIVNGITMVISVVAIYFFHNTLGIQEHIAKLFFITPITMVLNYFGYKNIVFMQKDSK